MENKFYILLIAILLSVSCSDSGKREVEYVDLVSDKMMAQLSDSSFFNNVPCITEYQGDVYISDKKRCQIFRMDSNLNMLKTIGLQGHGPQDLGYIEQFAISQDTIFVGDVTKMRILRFSTDGRFCGSENPNEKIPLNFRFSLDADHAYYFSHGAFPDCSLTEYDRGGGESCLKPFGNVRNFGSPDKNYGQNKRNVHRYDSNLIVVPLSIPAIEIYDVETKQILKTVDITNVPVVQAMYQKAANDRTIAESPNSFYLIFLDSYLHKNALYILSSVYVNDKLDHSVLLEFDLSGGGAQWVRQYDFPDWVMKICVTDDYVYGFVPQSASIKRYPLPKK